MIARRHLGRYAGLALLIVLAAVLIGLTIAVHAISPMTGPGDILDLVFAPRPDSGSLAQRIKSDQRINVLLMADGGAGADNPSFTDTVIVVSIRPSSRTASVISLPRNLWVLIPAPPGAEV